MQTKKYITLAVALATVGSLALAASAFAQDNSVNVSGGVNVGVNLGGGRGRGGMGMMPAVVGTVSSISGNSITVSGRQGFKRGGDQGTTNTTPPAAVSYTVDATNAKVTKDNVASTVSAIAVGDTIAVQGKVSGTNVTATTIRDGAMMVGSEQGGVGVGGTVSAINGTTLTVTGKGRPTAGSTTATTVTYTIDASSATVTKNNAASTVSAIAVGDMVRVQGTVSGTNVTAKAIMDGVVPGGQPEIQGNGQPVVAGKITSISGSSITITNNSNVTYTVDATNAKFSVPGVTTPTISSVSVGDNLVVQGTVNGNSVTATSVIDQKARVSGSDNMMNNPKPMGGFGGMMDGIGNFFKKLFGF